MAEHISENTPYWVELQAKLQQLENENKQLKQQFADESIKRQATENELYRLKNKILNINPLADMLAQQSQSLGKEHSQAKADQPLLMGAWIESLLLQTEIRLALAEEVAEMGIWDWHAQTNQTYYSANYYRILGYEVDEFIPSYERWVSLIHPEDLEKSIESQKKCVEGITDMHEVEARMLHKTLGYQWFWTRAAVVERNEQGKAKRMIGICLNIQAKKMVEEALQSSEREFMKIIDQNAAAMFIYDDKGYVFVNQEFKKLFGYTDEESQYLLIYDIIHPDATPEIAVMLRNFEKYPDRKFRFDIKSCTKRGTTLWIDMTLVSSFYQGRQIKVVSIYDITTRKTAEEELKATIEELRAAEEELRQNSEELQAINDHLAQAKEQLEHSLANEKLTLRKIEHKNKQLYEQRNKLKRTLHELKRTQEHLIQSEKMASLGVLVAGIAHELNNPINYISNSSEALQMIVEYITQLLQKFDTLDAQNIAAKMQEIKQFKQKIRYEELIQDIDELVHNIAFGAEQTAEIVRGLRTFTQFDGGQKEKVQLPDLIDSTLIVLHNQYRENIAIIKNYPTFLPELLCFPSKINQVLMNLLSNAIFATLEKHPQSGGIIQITITTDTQKLGKEAICVMIQDNGTGIPDSIKSRIFEPFFTNKEIGKGTGLGLAISLNIVNSHEGSLTFQSTEGQGTTFAMYLPLTS